MVQPVVTRSQRRIERKQSLSIFVLILVVAGLSFYLGMQFGKHGGPEPTLSDDLEKQTLPTVTQVKPPPKPAQTEEGKSETLTFYDNLPKGKQAPLGSGINLPPKKSSEPQDNAAVKVKAAELPPEPKPKAQMSPPASSDGDFVVQVASFRTAEDAKKLADRLKTYNMTTFVEKADLGEKGTWHRVLSGPYDTRESANGAASLLREKERLSALVRQR